MNEDLPTPEPTNKLEVVSSKQYKKHNQQNDESYGPPIATSTPDKNTKSILREAKTVLVPASILTRNHLPKIPICPNKYSPMPYTFRVPSYGPTSISKGKAQSPPFCLLLDNALAVVWCLFAKTVVPKPIGIVQLQWALSFLETIVNRRGEHPKDVNVCITTILDQLLELYADLVSELHDYDPSTDQHQKSMKKSSQEVIEEAHETSSSPNVKRGAFPKLPDTHLDDIVKNIPFSLNYTDIVNMSQRSTTNYSIDAAKSGRSISAKSKDELTSFLHSWKQEQIDKIQSELQRLHSIENFIGNCEKNSTQPHLADKELHVLLAEKNKRNNTT